VELLVSQPLKLLTVDIKQALTGFLGGFLFLSKHLYFPAGLPECAGAKARRE
jgi:hypothetical protein